MLKHDNNDSPKDLSLAANGFSEVPGTRYDVNRSALHSATDTFWSGLTSLAGDSVTTGAAADISAGTSSQFVKALRALQERFPQSSIGLDFDLSGEGFLATYQGYLRDRKDYPHGYAPDSVPIPQDLYPERSSIIRTLSDFFREDNSIITALVAEMSRDHTNQSIVGGRQLTLGSVLANIVNYLRVPEPERQYSPVEIARSLSDQKVRTQFGYSVDFSSHSEKESYRISSADVTRLAIEKSSYDFYAILVGIKRVSGVSPKAMLDLFNIDPKLKQNQSFSPKKIIELASGLTGYSASMKAFNSSNLLT